MTPPVTTQAARDAANRFITLPGRDGDRLREALALAFAKVIAEEVERCARIADAVSARYDYSTTPGAEQRQLAAREIATAIRATVGEVGK